MPAQGPLFRFFQVASTLGDGGKTMHLTHDVARPIFVLVVVIALSLWYLVILAGLGVVQAAGATKRLVKAPHGRLQA